MISLPTALMGRCRDALLKCNKFDSHESLKTVFAVKELQPFKDALPEATDREDRVDKVIHFLLEKKGSQGQPAFIAFLNALCIYVNADDELHITLSQLYVEVEYELYSSSTYNGHVADIPGSPLEQQKKIYRLVRSFLQCRSMPDEQVREEVLQLFLVETGQDLSSSGRKSPFLEVLRIVQACLHHPDGIEKLAFALYQKEGEFPQWQVLDTLLRNMSGKAVTYARQQQLRSILLKAAWPDKILRKAYHRSLPDGWELQPLDALLLLPSILENLAVAPRQHDSSIPILLFAYHLAQYAWQHQEKPIQDALMRWIEERGQELGLDTTQMAVMSSKVQAYASAEAYYLLVTLDPAEDDTTFYVRAWLQDQEGTPIVSVSIETPEEPIAFEHITTVLDDALEKCWNYLIDEINKLVIEFALPNVLFHYPLDHVPVDNGMESVKLGIQHKVVVRSLERINRKKVWPLWKNKWNILQNFIEGNFVVDDARNPVWICDEDQFGTHESLYSALRYPSTVCLALTFAPRDKLIGAGSILNAILGAGIPIALWPRKHTRHPQRNSDLFASNLSQETLSNMPKLVWEQRLEAGRSKDKDHPGHHLTLLWDDPNRLPPTATAMQFAMPQARRGNKV